LFKLYNTRFIFSSILLVFYLSWCTASLRVLIPHLHQIPISPKSVFLPTDIMANQRNFGFINQPLYYFTQQLFFTQVCVPTNCPSA